MATLKDKLWLWGQDTSSHQRAAGNAKWKLPDSNQMNPVQGAEYLGIPNIYRVVMCGQPEPPFDAESAKMKDMRQVVWSAMGDSGSRRNDQSSDLEEVLRQAKKFPNIVGAVLDDFFAHRTEPVESWARYSIGQVRAMRERLHQASLDLRVVWYKRQLEFDIDDYLREFDVITYWNMNAPAEHSMLHRDLERMIERTPGKRRMTGCYIWNYEAGKPLTVEEIKFECEVYSDLIRQGKSEGIVFCSNCCADLPENRAAVEWLRNWIKEKSEA